MTPTIDPTEERPQWHMVRLWWLLFALTIPLKLISARHMPFDHDYIPVIGYGWQWLQGMGDALVPAYGTLSSVGAYNMPMLVWLYTPVQLITQDVFAVIIITGIVLNAVGAWAVWRWATLMLGVRVGWVATGLWMFSEVAITSSYTAWAQVHLPVFFAGALYCAWRWWDAETGRQGMIWLALMGGVTFAGFMMHFATVMLFVALFVGALLVRARWTWQGLLMGGLVCAVLIAPYVVFQQGRDWVDIRAFLNREPYIETAIMDDAQAYVEQASEVAPETAPDVAPETAPDVAPEQAPEVAPEVAPHWRRAIDRALTIPADLIDALILPSRLGNPAGGWLVFFVLLTWVRVLVWGIRALVYRRGRWWAVDWRTDATGRLALLGVVWVVFALALILTRNTPDVQATYYMGTISWYMVWGAAGLVWASEKVIRRTTSEAWRERLQVAVLVLAVLVFALGNSIERIQRVRQWDEGRTDAANIWQYRHIETITAMIATGHQGEAPVVVYDLLRYQPQLWWVGAWHTVDERYTAGMPFDHLLMRYYGLSNGNQDGFGGVDEATLAQADFIVTTVAGATQYTGVKTRVGGLVLVIPEARASD